ncbi:hypothetical protein PIB30_056759 [Stylosanthes scabra]|uniref:Uncharacterized protein n=1 Tax=Stylosanthes scabra TaxID=79078 RepID=A0ABU6SJD5_9FABA|nr:hypothetical protein [Stylosanthes scabra]
MRAKLLHQPQIDPETTKSQTEQEITTVSTEIQAKIEEDQEIVAAESDEVESNEPNTGLDDAIGNFEDRLADEWSELVKMVVVQGPPPDPPGLNSQRKQSASPVLWNLGCANSGCTIILWQRWVSWRKGDTQCLDLAVVGKEKWWRCLTADPKHGRSVAPCF